MKVRINGLVIISSILLVVSGVYGQINLPQTSGFGGYFLTGPGIFSVKSNLLVTGPPLTGKVGDAQIRSVFDAPNSNSSFALALAGELNYTFAESRTQIFFGNGIEDILRLDVPVGLGVRHQLMDNSILMLRVLTTPLKLKFWEDPYVENEDREQTQLNFPGVRFRWARMFETGFEFTTTVRKYDFGRELSGEWLISEGRLNPDAQGLLDRNGFVYRFQGLYQFNLDEKSVLRPAIRYVIDDHKGRALANKGYALKMTYLRRTPKMILDGNLLFGQRFMSARHPVYGERIDSYRIHASLSAFIPIKFFNSKRWNIWISGDYIWENSKVTFFDSSVIGVMGGLMYRFNRK